jgi:hypothetical protein
MDLYQIITDEAALIEFIEWLPDLEDNEAYYLSLFARKKYCPDLIKSNDKTQLKRFTATKENMLKKIKQLELPLGRWWLKDTVAPQESLVLYILPNPRNMAKANRMMGKKAWDLDRSKNYNLIAEATSCVQKSKSRACFVDFDIDDKDADLSLMDKIMPPHIHTMELYSVIQTRGGYHILVRPERVSKLCYTAPKNWHGEICKTFNVDQSGDQMIPVPGCVQGGFTPKMINYGTTL